MTDRKEPLDIEKAEYCRMIAAKLNKTDWAAPSAGREIARFGAAIRQEVRGVLPAAGYRLSTAPLRPAAPRRPLGVRHDDLLFIIGVLLGFVMSGEYHPCFRKYGNRLEQSVFQPQTGEVKEKNQPRNPKKSCPLVVVPNFGHT